VVRRIFILTILSFLLAGCATDQKYNPTVGFGSFRIFENPRANRDDSPWVRYGFMLTVEIGPNRRYRRTFDFHESDLNERTQRELRAHDWMMELREAP
jgi:hypothetical protein